MRLSEALTIVNKPFSVDSGSFPVFLACGFTPLHLQTFLAARLRVAMPEHLIEIRTGRYGDILGNLERLGQAVVDCGVIVLEWADLDLRLGLRGLGGWVQSGTDDVLESVETRISAIQQMIDKIPGYLPLVICLPSLPLLPIDSTVPAWKAGLFNLRLRKTISSFALWAGEKRSVKLVNADYLNELSPMNARLDVKSELLNGFPYSLEHTSILSELVCALIRDPAPKKGLITDLDNTLWRGILGELGPQHISWDFDRKAHMHGVYQALLRSLALNGVLIAVASKNSAALVAEAFQRRDLILREENVFPSEVHWGPKSESVSRILETWNISPDSVVFVDDSPTELAEVKAVHPAMECLQFPTEPQGIYDLLLQLRNRFSKLTISNEDLLRLTSIRNRPRERFGASVAASDSFLERAESVITFSSIQDLTDARVIELINKTNQFNLNGVRHTEASLQRMLNTPNAFILNVSYKDKFGPLGQIATLVGSVRGTGIQLHIWVMSCRAFSRRIEHACLDHLFRTFLVEGMEFDFKSTDRNTPLQEFLTELLGQSPGPQLRLSRSEFYRACPQLFAQVEEAVHG